MLFPETELSPAKTENKDYLVLARKYRPQHFEGLIGQSDLIETLRRSIEKNRLAHAYLFSGTRGIGKTTSARILAKALNCTGPDNTKTEPTAEPCGVCDNCLSIAESRHIDVYEMDAASRTGIDDVREIIDSVKYKPVRARYKVFIIDEAHMLSKQAFNGFLKTLEEPPPHVKFIFATTEAQKIPVTVLSRCQRIDLKKIDASTLITRLAEICDAEKAEYEKPALGAIARAAAGSVRDALSLLDRALAQGDGKADMATVKEMLGASDEQAVVEIIAALSDYDIAGSLNRFNALTQSGVDPTVFLKEALRYVEFLSRLKHAPGLAADDALTAEMRETSEKLSQKLTVPLLSRFWKTLLETLKDSEIAPDPAAACEMGLIRMTYGADAPDPTAILRSGRIPEALKTAPPKAPAPAPAPSPEAESTDMPEPEAKAPETLAPPATFEALLTLLEKKRELLLKNRLESELIVLDYTVGKLVYRPANAQFDDRAAAEMRKALTGIVGIDWILERRETASATEQTVADKKRAAKEALKEKIEAHPFMQKVRETFPGCVIEDVKQTLPSDESLAPPEERDDKIAD